MQPSNQELKERYASWSNKKLLAVIHYKNQYTSQAVEIARRELGQRHITAEDVDTFLHELEQQRNREKLLSSISLTFWEKLRCFFLWFLPTRPVGKGFTLKEQQSSVFSVGGFISFFVDAFIVLHFRLPVTAGLAILPLFFAGFLLYERQGRRNLSS